MESELLEFISRRNIEISLKPSGGQNGLPVPSYDVILRKGEKGESFVILGDTESEQRITPEDALRALLIRVQLHENNAIFASGLDIICRETATRLKEFLGPSNYSDFLNLEANPKHKKFEKEKPGFKSLHSYTLHFQNLCIGLCRLSRKIIVKIFFVLSIPLAYI